MLNTAKHPGLLPPPLLAAGEDALFIDFDGTLVEIASRPDRVKVRDGVIGLLRDCFDLLAGRLVLVSGRTIRDLDSSLGWSSPLAAGAHGAEFRGAAAHFQGQLPGLLQALGEARGRLSQLPPVILVEDKGLSIALHYRQHPHLEVVALTFAEDIARSSGGHLMVQKGRMVLELKSITVNKGSAVQQFMAEPLFRGSRAVFAGDDLTDENGFKAAASLGGHGVLVGAERPTSAAYLLDNVEAVHRWLKSSVEKEKKHAADA